jgi:hypothetical protein
MWCDLHHVITCVGQPLERLLENHMTRNVLGALAAGFWLAAVTGCANLNSQARRSEAADLAQRNLGTRPAWDDAWDNSPPWEADAVLTPDRAVGIALRNNRELRADLEMIGEADADLLQAGLMQNPVIQLMLAHVPRRRGQGDAPRERTSHDAASGSLVDPRPSQGGQSRAPAGGSSCR